MLTGDGKERWGDGFKRVLDDLLENGLEGESSGSAKR